MSASSVDKRQGNLLLACMSDADRAMIKPKLQPIELTLRRALETKGRTTAHVHFVDSGIVSVVARSATGGQPIEVGIVGREGVTGASAILGADRSPYDVFVQHEGSALRMTTKHLHAAMDESTSFRKLMLRSVHVFNLQTAHTALANGRGKLEERLARWLVMAHDRVDGDELTFTHEFLALMLGVRRPGVTVALTLLENDGLITRQRSAVRVVDRQGLEETAGDFYGGPEAELRRIIG